MDRSPREAIAELVIIFSVVVGAWFLLVEGRVRKLQDLEEQIAQSETHDLTKIDELIKQFAAQADDMRRGIEYVRSRSELGEDSKGLYDQIVACARRNDIDLERLTPSQSRQSGEGPVDRSRVSLHVRASYRNLVDFVADLRSVEGFIRPVSLRLSPLAATVDECAGQLECEIVSIDVPEALVALWRVSDDAE